MPELNQRSRDKLSTCHPDLWVLAEEAAKHMDFIIVCGYRDKKDQSKAYAGGYSNALWPDSKHNHMTKKLVDDKLEMAPESLAIDVAPLPLNWKDIERFCILIGVFKACASILNIQIRFGRDIRKGDYGHIELYV